MSVRVEKGRERKVKGFSPSFPSSSKSQLGRGGRERRREKIHSLRERGGREIHALREERENTLSEREGEERWNEENEKEGKEMEEM